MASNSLYPGFIRLVYTGNAHLHIQTIPIISIDPSGGSYNIGLRGGTQDLWTDAIVDYITVAKPFLAAADDFVSASLWEVPTIGADPIFLEETMLGIAGTGGTAVANSQTVITFRTNQGGLYRWYLMEGSNAVDVIVNPPFAGAAATFVAYMVGATSLVAGRDGGLLTSAVRYVTKINDALRKKYFLNV